MPGRGFARRGLEYGTRCLPGKASRTTADPTRATARVLQGVAVVTALADGVPHGMTISSLSVLGMAPPTVALAVRTTGSMHDILLRAKGFAISLLADDQEFTARFFASRNRPTGADQFARFTCRPGRFSGAPLLIDALGWLDCRLVARVPLGTHLLVIGQVLQDVSSHRDAAVPLLYGDGRYHRRPDHAPTGTRRLVGRDVALDHHDAERG